MSYGYGCMAQNCVPGLGAGGFWTRSLSDALSERTQKKAQESLLGGGVSQICVLFIPNPGEMIQFHDHFF